MVTVYNTKIVFSTAFVFNNMSVTKKVVTVGDTLPTVTNCHHKPRIWPPACILLKIKKINKKKKGSVTNCHQILSDTYVYDSTVG